MRRRIGFTLIELMVVVTIIGLLAAIMIPALSGSGRKARARQAVIEAQQAQEQLQADEQLYEAWRKATGNEKNLRFEEWRALKNAGLLEAE